MSDVSDRGPARYIMIGGFLGAGKTTAVAAFAKELTERGLRVGLITNDQSTGLVDTRMLAARGYAVEEISGGCFCCRFQSLSEAAERLDDATRPDVFIAEPVGSCTDLVATVSYPLRRIYGERFTIAPLSVLVDPERAERVLGLSTGRAFSEKVVYVYLKQLEEADLIVVNKCDRFSGARRDALVARLGERFPEARVLCASALEGQGLADWLAFVCDEETPLRQPMDVDYRVYGEGEALLGWLNCTARVESPSLFDANALLMELGNAVRGALGERGIEIAHFKVTLDAGQSDGSLAAMSLTSSDGAVDLRESLIDGVRGGELLINLRAEADPGELDTLLGGVLRELTQRQGLELCIEHSEHFRPGQPTPTHRMGASEVGEMRALAGRGGPS